MVVDASAIMAILFREPEADRITDAVSNADEIYISAATMVEIEIVQFSSNGASGLRECDSLMNELLPDVVPVTASQARIASDAFQLYGKGQHPARLNSGDCFTHALAEEMGEPILFKGNDFALTDLEAVACRDSSNRT